MTHRKKVLTGVLFGVIYWLIVSIGVFYGHSHSNNGNATKYSREVRFANTISYEIKAERFGSLAKDNLGREGGDRDSSYTGISSYYGDAFEGRTTACGDIFNPRDFTAASLRHRCGARLRICALDGDRCVDIVVNDRGPYIEGRVLDLAEAAFAGLAPLSQGLLEVEITELK